MRNRAAALITLALVAALGACSTPDTTSSAGGSGPITVTATDTECTVARSSAAAGDIEFTIANKGTKVNEFYVYAEGDRIVGEVENIAPGLTRSLNVRVAEPGTYQTACRPGMVGNGIRADFTVTGKSAAAQADNAMLTAATASYQTYVNNQIDALLQQTTAFVAAVKAGDVAKAKAIYPIARTHYERVEPVAESFGDLDPKIDGRADVVDDGMTFTGFHRLEKDLWTTGLRADSAAMADTLLVDVQDLATRGKALTYNPLQLANGSKSLLDEMATGKITGEEERYSHTDLYDYAANWDGSKAAVAALRPYLNASAPQLLTSYDTHAKAMDAIIARYARGEGFLSFTDLTKADVKALSDALDAVSADVAQVAGVVAKA